MADYVYRGSQPWTPGNADPETRRPKRIVPVQPCGTPAAARRHIKYGEPVDDACRQAIQADNRRYAAERKARQKASAK